MLALGSGHYTLDGGDGNDLLNFSGSASSLIEGGNGNDTVAIFGSGASSLDGGVGDDKFVYTASAGTNDTIDGGAGSDTVSFQGKSWTNDVASETTDGSGVTTIVFTPGSGGNTVFVQNVEQLNFTDKTQSPPPFSKP